MIYYSSVSWQKVLNVSHTTPTEAMLTEVKRNLIQQGTQKVQIS